MYRNQLNSLILAIFITVGLSIFQKAGAQTPMPNPPANLALQNRVAPSPVVVEPSPAIIKPQIVIAPSPSGKKGFKYMYAIIETSMGKIKAKLLPEVTPKTVDNFVGLAEGTKEWKDPVTQQKKKSHFYDGLSFHRIIPKFMIQGGDPQGTGMGGPGYDFADERNQDVNFDKAGILAMANRGPNTNGSQFFITTDPVTFLNDRPGQHYTIFGEVIEGMDVVKKISQVPTDKTNDRPLKPVKIVKVTIQRK